MGDKLPKRPKKSEKPSKKIIFDRPKSKDVSPEVNKTPELKDLVKGTVFEKSLKDTDSLKMGIWIAYDFPLEYVNTSISVEKGKLYAVEVGMGANYPDNIKAPIKFDVCDKLNENLKGFVGKEATRELFKDIEDYIKGNEDELDSHAHVWPVEA